jgi:iron complex outermembrane receptor protein
LRDNYNSAVTSATLGTATQGGGTEWLASQLYGTSWSGGNVLLNYEHQEQHAVFADERKFTSTAPDPFSLLPEMSRDSFFVGLHHDLTSSIQVFANGIYAHRSSDAVGNYGVVDETKTATNQLIATAGLNFSLPLDWKAILAGSASNQRTGSVGTFLNIDYNGTVHSIDAIANGRLFDLPSGSVRLAVGADYRKEGYFEEDAYPGYTGGPSVAADRSVSAEFAELSVPLVLPSDRVGLKRLDLNISGRHENYSDFGGTTVPKLGIVYEPASGLHVHGTWGKSFTAPRLYAIHSQIGLGLFSIPDPLVPSGMSPVLSPSGGNPDLKPETARTWTAGIDFKPEWVRGLTLSGTYFSIDYTNRLFQIPNFFAGLTDPADAFAVTRNPSAQTQANLISLSSTGLSNYTGSAYDPATVAAIVDFRQFNIARQDVHGADIEADYKAALRRGSIDLFLNAAALRIAQQTTPTSPNLVISGTTFNPPKVRARGGVTWNDDVWAVTAIVNYLGGSTNTGVPEQTHIGSWTTTDVNVTLTPQLSGFLEGFKISLSVQNLFDVDPPTVIFNQFLTGFNYDSANTTPLGRFVQLSVAKKW